MNAERPAPKHIHYTKNYISGKEFPVPYSKKPILYKNEVRVGDIVINSKGWEDVDVDAIFYVKKINPKSLTLLKADQYGDLIFDNDGKPIKEIYKCNTKVYLDLLIKDKNYI